MENNIFIHGIKETDNSIYDNIFKYPIIAISLYKKYLFRNIGFIIQFDKKDYITGYDREVSSVYNYELNNRIKKFNKNHRIYKHTELEELYNNTKSYNELWVYSNNIEIIGKYILDKDNINIPSWFKKLQYPITYFSF